MHFRQRVAWLLLAVFLISTACCLYYIFEISTQFGMFALEHADESHQDVDNPLRPSSSSPELDKTADQINEVTLWFDQVKAKLWSFSSHVADVPLPVIGFLILVVYLQVGCLGCSCELSICVGSKA